MGFFDKIKASVGIGGAQVELVVPTVATSGSKVPVHVTVRGGKLEQRLNGVELSLEVWPESDPHRPKEQPAPGPQVTALGRIPGSEGKTIAPNAQLLFETAVAVPECQTLYTADPERYAYLVVDSDDEEDPTLWNVDGPLPMTDGWESSTVHVLVSADIPGAIDPSSKTRIHVIPEASKPLTRATDITSDAALTAALEAAGAHRVFLSNVGDNWFAWWSGGDGRVVAYSPVKAVCSLRAEGIVRSYANPNIPEPSRLAKLPRETAEQCEGDMDDARALATRLIEEAKAGVLLPRPVGNAWFALTSLMIAR